LLLAGPPGAALAGPPGAALAGPPGAALAGPSGGAGPVVLWAAGTPATGVRAYDGDAVPATAALALVSSSAGRTRTVLTARGLLPRRTYGAHLHTRACGADPAAAGPHYQRVPDPVQPSTDPAYANPRNEVWLDLRTDTAGSARTLADNPWRYREPPPRSLVLHATGTATHPGHAGTAGARLACLTLRGLPG
jgi:Cu-Zn family superoxide dismutase